MEDKKLYWYMMSLVPEREDMNTPMLYVSGYDIEKNIEIDSDKVTSDIFNYCPPFWLEHKDGEEIVHFVTGETYRLADIEVAYDDE